jgi:hypothetical protein
MALQHNTRARIDFENRAFDPARIDRWTFDIGSARDSSDRDNKKVPAARKQDVMWLDANGKALAGRKRPCIAQDRGALACLGIDLGSEQGVAFDSGVAGEAVTFDRIEKPRWRIRCLQIDHGCETAWTSPDQQHSTGIAHEHGSMRPSGQREAHDIFIDENRTTIDAIDARSGHERGAGPLRSRARIVARQAERAADECAESGIEQATPVDLEISRHRDC